jgi:hypothetical protein
MVNTALNERLILIFLAPLLAVWLLVDPTTLKGQFKPDRRRSAITLISYYLNRRRLPIPDKTKWKSAKSTLAGGARIEPESLTPNQVKFEIRASC